MKRKRWCSFLLLLFLWTSLALPAQAAEVLSGSEQWQPYLAQSPVKPEAFAENPLGALRELLPDDPLSLLRTTAASYADLLLFLLLAMLLSFLSAEMLDRGLLDLLAAGGCGVLLWEDLMQLAVLVGEKTESWRTFLMGFLPVYAGVLTLGGESAAGASAGGLLLTALCFLAQLIAAWTPPLLQCYLSLSIACCISTEAGLPQVCKAVGKLLRQCLGWAGKLFVFLLGLQRVVTLQLDRSTAQMGRLLTGTVPIIGQTLSDAAEAVLSGVQLLKSGLGLSALAILCAEFVPLYLHLLLHLLLLTGCALLCEAAGSARCGALFGCLIEAVRGMAAVTALFFGIAVFGTTIMFAVGGG